MVERENVDEVLLSTLPPSVPRCFGMDLKRRIQRPWNLPVTSVVVGY